MPNTTLNQQIKRAMAEWLRHGVLPMEAEVVSLDPVGIPIPKRDRRFGVHVTFARFCGSLPLWVGEFNTEADCRKECRRIERLMDRYYAELTQPSPVNPTSNGTLTAT